MIKTIVILALGIAIGIFIGFPISKILIKKYKRKITNDSIEKILGQKKNNFQTLKPEPVDLNFINDGKKIDFKKEVKDGLIKTKIKEIRGYKEEIKEIKKSKKQRKKDGKATK